MNYIGGINIIMRYGRGWKKSQRGDLAIEVEVSSGVGPQANDSRQPPAARKGKETDYSLQKGYSPTDSSLTYRDVRWYSHAFLSYKACANL